MRPWRESILRQTIEEDGARCSTSMAESSAIDMMNKEIDLLREAVEQLKMLARGAPDLELVLQQMAAEIEAQADQLER